MGLPPYWDDIGYERSSHHFFSFVFFDSSFPFPAIIRLTIEFFVKVASRRDGERSNKFLEFNRAILIFVKHTKYKRGELCRVSVGEELGVDLDEALLGEQTVGTVFEKSFVPLFDLFLSD